MRRWLRRRSPWHGVRRMALVETLGGTLACCCAARPGRCLRCVLGLHSRCSRPGYVMLGP